MSLTPEQRKQARYSIRRYLEGRTAADPLPQGRPITSLTRRPHVRTAPASRLGVQAFPTHPARDILLGGTATPGQGTPARTRSTAAAACPSTTSSSWATWPCPACDAEHVVVCRRNGGTNVVDSGSEAGPYAVRLLCRDDLLCVVRSEALAFDRGAGSHHDHAGRRPPAGRGGLRLLRKRRPCLAHLRPGQAHLRVSKGAARPCPAAIGFHAIDSGIYPPPIPPPDHVRERRPPRRVPAAAHDARYCTVNQPGVVDARHRPATRSTAAAQPTTTTGCRRTASAPAPQPITSADRRPPLLRPADDRRPEEEHRLDGRSAREATTPGAPSRSSPCSRSSCSSGSCSAGSHRLAHSHRRRIQRVPELRSEMTRRPTRCRHRAAVPAHASPTRTPA